MLKLNKNELEKIINMVLLLIAFLFTLIGLSILFKETNTISASDGTLLNKNQEKIPASLEESDHDIDKMIVVDIGGAVQNPGIYRLKLETRLADLVESAGGFDTKQIDKYFLHKTINLSEKLVDGKKYYLPFEGESAKISESGNSKETASDLVSVNQASLKTLTTLPGIGEVRAQAIIDGRPYSELKELVSKNVVTQKILDDILKLIEL